MAGSRRYFPYTTNAGNVIALELDESNSEAVNSSTEVVLPTAPIPPTATTKGFSPRAAFYARSVGDTPRRIKCVVLTQARFDAAFGTAAGVPSSIPDPIDPGLPDLLLADLVPEDPGKVAFPADTGILDGDNP